MDIAAKKRGVYFWQPSDSLLTTNHDVLRILIIFSPLPPKDFQMLFPFCTHVLQIFQSMSNFQSKLDLQNKNIPLINQLNPLSTQVSHWLGTSPALKAIFSLLGATGWLGDMVPLWLQSAGHSWWFSLKTVPLTPSSGQLFGIDYTWVREILLLTLPWSAAHRRCIKKIRRPYLVKVLPSFFLLVPVSFPWLMMNSKDVMQMALAYELSVLKTALCIKHWVSSMFNTKEIL